MQTDRLGFVIERFLFPCPVAHARFFQNKEQIRKVVNLWDVLRSFSEQIPPAAPGLILHHLSPEVANLWLRYGEVLSLCKSGVGNSASLVGRTRDALAKDAAAAARCFQEGFAASAGRAPCTAALRCPRVAPSVPTPIRRFPCRAQPDLGVYLTFGPRPSVAPIH